VKYRYLLLVCTAILLPSCASMMSVELASASKGMTYEQLVASQSSVKYVNTDAFPWIKEFCYRCDGQPIRTYTNKAGNKVAVYFYWSTVIFYGSCDQYSCDEDQTQCRMREQHFELINNVVVNAKWVFGYGARRPGYIDNACEGYKPYLGWGDD